MHVRVPAARDSQTIGGNSGAALNRKAGQSLAAGGTGHHRSGDHGRPIEVAGDAVTAVDYSSNVNALRFEVGGGAPAVVVVSEYRDAFAGGDAPTVDVGAHRARHHDAGAVVVLEGDRSFGGAGGEHRAFCIDAPQHLARLAAAGRKMVGLAFERAVHAMVEDTVNHGSAHHPNVRHRTQFGRSGLGPDRTGGVVDLVRLAQKPPAGAKIFVGQNDPRARTARRERRRQSRRSSPDNQHIAMQKAVIIKVGVGLQAEPPQTRRRPDKRLVDLFPKGFRPHKGFVVETGAQERGDQVVQPHDVVFQRPAMVLRPGCQPVKQLGHGGLGVGLLCRTGAKFDHTVRLFGPRGEYPARAVVFERPAHQPLSIGQQRRSQRVARMALHRLAVEGEIQRLATVDQSAVDTVGLVHLERPRARATSRASSTFVTSWVSVLRVTTSHDRSPCS